MTVLVTGAAGFLGARLVRALLDAPAGWPGIDRIVAVDCEPGAVHDPRVETKVGSVADAAFVDTLLSDDVRVVYHLAAVLSGGAEADFDHGLRVNVDATRALLEACRRQGNAPRFVLASTIAVFGGPLPAVVGDDQALRPQSSYGTAKAIAELLVAEYGRKGFVDALACRLATVAIRAGAPNSALSSFVSGIVREPLAGLPSTCPVPLDTPLWVSAPSTVVRNLLHAGTVRIADDGPRAFTLPGVTVTPGQLLNALERHGGPDARARVRVEPDPAIGAIVKTWPGAFDTARAAALGFEGDHDADRLVAEYVEERRGQIQPSSRPNFDAPTSIRPRP
jgi:nucleoside-diphosphate-sugar epimerase